MTSTERVTVPVVLADHHLLLSYCVVESPVLSLLFGRDVVGGLGVDIKGSIKTLEYNGRSQPLEDSVAGQYMSRVDAWRIVVFVVSNARSSVQLGEEVAEGARCRHTVVGDHVPISKLSSRA